MVSVISWVTMFRLLSTEVQKLQHGRFKFYGKHAPPFVMRVDSQLEHGPCFCYIKPYTLPVVMRVRTAGAWSVGSMGNQAPPVM